MACVCDVNFLLALGEGRHEHHPAARGWIGGVEEVGVVLICRVTQLGCCACSAMTR